jgi:hypothetical protein
MRSINFFPLRFLKFKKYFFYFVIVGVGSQMPIDPSVNEPATIPYLKVLGNGFPQDSLLKRSFTCKEPNNCALFVFKPVDQNSKVDSEEEKSNVPAILPVTRYSEYSGVEHQLLAAHLSITNMCFKPNLLDKFFY